MQYSASVISSCSVWLCWSQFLINFSLNYKKSWSAKSSYNRDFILLMFMTFWTPSLSNLLRYVSNLIKLIFHQWTDKIKLVHDEKIFLEIIYLVRDIEGFALFCYIAFFILNHCFSFLWEKTLFTIIFN